MALLLRPCCLDAQNGDCLLHGYLHKLGGPFQSVWTKKYFFLYPNRLEYRGEQSVGFYFIFSKQKEGFIVKKEAACKRFVDYFDSFKK